jgi:hypothetical protein
VLDGGTLPAFTNAAPPLPDDATEEIVRLRLRSRVFVDASVKRMSANLPDVARYNPQQLARTEEDVAHIVDFLCAAVFVDDATLFTDFTQWLHQILVPRGVPAETVRRGIEIVRDVLADDPSGPFPRARQVFAAALS